MRARVLPTPRARKRCVRDPVRSGRRWDRRRHDHRGSAVQGGLAAQCVTHRSFSGFRYRSTHPTNYEQNEGGGTPADAYLQPPRPRLHPPRLRGRTEEGARRASTQTSVRKSAHTKSTRRAACRRSTAALAAASQRRSSAPDALPGRDRGASCPSPASSSQAGHSAGRALLRSRPGAQVTSPRPREPLPLRRPVSPADVLHERDSSLHVTETVMNVKKGLHIGDNRSACQLTVKSRSLNVTLLVTRPATFRSIGRLALWFIVLPIVGAGADILLPTATTIHSPSRIISIHTLFFLRRNWFSCSRAWWMPVDHHLLAPLQSSF